MESRHVSYLTVLIIHLPLIEGRTFFATSRKELLAVTGEWHCVKKSEIIGDNRQWDDG
jgi:hypothetical protein